MKRKLCVITLIMCILCGLNISLKAQQPVAGQKYRIKVVTSGTYAGQYLTVNSYDEPTSAVSTVGVSTKSESNSQIFTLEYAGDANAWDKNYYIRTADGYYIKCADTKSPGADCRMVFAYSTDVKTPLTLYYTNDANFYIRDYDKSAGVNQNKTTNNIFYIANGGSSVYCNGASNTTGVVTWTLEEVVSTAPAAPVLAAEALSHDRISLSWNAVNGAIKYNVYDGNGSLIAENITETSYVVTGLNPEINYCYTVTAINAKAEESEHSNEACATTDAAPVFVFPAPTNLQATVTNGTTITLTWNTVDGAVKYNVYTGSNVVEATNNTYTFMGNANTRYCFTVTAIDGEETESAKSEEVCAATIPAAPTN